MACSISERSVRGIPEILSTPVTTVAPPLTEGHVEVEAGCSTGAGLTHVFIADSPST